MTEKKTWKAEDLRSMEKNVQTKWKESENDRVKYDASKETYFVTFPYPYMNGRLHLGHGYTMSKQDFASRFHRLLGHNVLETFSFHLTGMPIVAASDKLIIDIKKIKQGIEPENGSQYSIMKMMDIPEPEIEKFTDPVYWGKYFPQIAAKTLKRFGMGYDETRSFITTSENPFYDSFVKWHFTILFKKQMLRFGARHCIYSVQEKQPCLGHERSIGEDVKPKKYWFVPYELCDFKIDEQESEFTKTKVYLIATTSRPETLSSVTNLWINNQSLQVKTHPGMLNSDFTLFHVKTRIKEMYWIIRELAMIGISHQYTEADDFHIESVKNLGTIGPDRLLNIKAIDHFSNNNLIPIQLSRSLIDPIKGSGTIPGTSDGPKSKSELESKDCDCAQNIEMMDTRQRIEDQLITYYEPESHAFSRSGNPLIVAKVDQWYIDYGDQKWKEDTMSHVEQMEFSDPVVRESLITAIQWLDQWPCSRTYGLGTYFPKTITESDFLVDQRLPLVDSLSDSTIYMALYTIYHYFAAMKIDPKEMTDQVWDYIFLLKDHDNPGLSKFSDMRDEFIHWYPMDLRVSAKDLIPNHLAMSIFNHCIVWDQEFKERLEMHYPGKNNNFGPMRYEINGYISVQKQGHPEEKEKMSKSKGNFKTLDQVIDMYCADAVRFTFASACKGTDDAYFDQDLCTKMIEKLYKEKEWINEVFSHNANGEKVWRTEYYPEQIFINEMNCLKKETINAYDQMDYQAVVTNGFHMMQKCRDTYLEMVPENENNYDLLKSFIEMQLTLMYPIIPHFCDHFANKGIKYSIDQNQNQNHIQGSGINPILSWEHEYLTQISQELMKKVSFVSKKKPVNKIKIYISSQPIDPMESAIRQIIDECMSVHKELYENKEMIDEVTKINEELTKDNKSIGQLVKYYKYVKKLITEHGYLMFSQIINNCEEFNALINNLKYYLKFKKTDNVLIRDYLWSIQIIDCAKKSEYGIRNVRTFDPVILIE
jgi:leucyl-tRNA synthetase